MESDQTAIGKTLSGMEVITGSPALNGGEPEVKFRAGNQRPRRVGTN